MKRLISNRDSKIIKMGTNFTNADVPIEVAGSKLCIAFTQVEVKAAERG